MANVHRIQDYRSNPQQGPQSSSRNFLANLSQQNVGTTEMVKMSMDYRVPFLCKHYFLLKLAKIKSRILDIKITSMFLEMQCVLLSEFYLLL